MGEQVPGSILAGPLLRGGWGSLLGREKGAKSGLALSDIWLAAASAWLGLFRALG
jgi:hypothetical protein